MLQEFMYTIVIQMFYKNLNSAVETVERKTLPLHFKLCLVSISRIFMFFDTKEYLMYRIYMNC